MEPSASAMFTSAPFSRKAFTNQHVWSAGLFTVFNKAKLACSFCFSCFFSSCNRTRAMNDQTALLMRKVALRHLSLRHVASMEHPEEVIHGAADESKRQKAAAAASTDAPAPQQSQQECINYFLFFGTTTLPTSPTVQCTTCW